LQIGYREKFIILEIQDDGLGFDAKKFAKRKTRRGLGTTNMRERALSLGGSCEIISALNKGTTVSVRIPYDH
jgi:signal transduction histidine kinase